MDIKDKIRDLLVYIKLLKVDNNKSRMIKYNLDNYNEEYFINKMKDIKIFDYRWYEILDIIDNLLLNVGFNNGDNILINDINFILNNSKNEYDYVIDFSVNGEDCYKFIFRYNDIWDMKPMFIFVKGNERYCYNISFNDREDNLLSLKNMYYEVCMGDILYRREYSYMKANYVVLKDDYTLNLEIYKQYGYLNNKDDDYRYVLDNEDMLRYYLMNLEFPVRIDSVYDKIQREFLGNISDYPMINLEVMTFDHINGIDVISDKILIKDGKWKMFGMTNGNKIVMLEDNGNWSYKLLDSNLDVKISMKMDDDISYTIHGDSKEELEQYFSMYLVNDMVDVNKGIENTKKLVKKMFGGNDRYDR